MPSRLVQGETAILHASCSHVQHQLHPKAMSDSNCIRHASPAYGSAAYGKQIGQQLNCDQRRVEREHLAFTSATSAVSGKGNEIRKRGHGPLQPSIGAHLRKATSTSRRAASAVEWMLARGKVVGPIQAFLTDHKASTTAGQ